MIHWIVASTKCTLIQNVTVNSNSFWFIFCFGKADTTPPEVNGCPNNFRSTTELGTTRKVITWTEPTATDLSGTPTRTRSHQPGAEFSLGVTSVRYTFTDASNNEVMCSFTVTLDTGKLSISFFFQIDINYGAFCWIKIFLYQSKIVATSIERISNKVKLFRFISLLHKLYACD